MSDSGAPAESAAAGCGGDRFLAVLLGRPGSGKTSAAALVVANPGVEVLRTRDLLEVEAERETALGRELTRQMAAGEFVGTDLVTRVLRDRVEASAAPLVVLDGFPRREDQISPLYRMARDTRRQLSLVIVLVVPRSTAERRLTGRRVCSECGKVYNLHYDPPPRDACARCGGRLERRADDRPAVVRARQDRFEEETKPVIRWFGIYRPDQTRCVPAGGPPAQVQQSLLQLMHECHPAIVPGPGRDAGEMEGGTR